MWMLNRRIAHPVLRIGRMSVPWPIRHRIRWTDRRASLPPLRYGRGEAIRPGLILGHRAAVAHDRTPSMVAKSAVTGSAITRSAVTRSVVTRSVVTVDRHQVGSHQVGSHQVASTVFRLTSRGTHVTWSAVAMSASSFAQGRCTDPDT
jgi:hypothetical protein